MDKYISKDIALLKQLPKDELIENLRKLEMNILFEYCKTKTYYHEIAPEIAKAILEHNKERLIQKFLQWDG